MGYNPIWLRSNQKKRGHGQTQWGIMWKHWKKMLPTDQRERSQDEAKPTDIFMLDFQPLDCEEIILCETTWSVVFIMAVLAN